MRAVSLFSGVGGMDRGLQLAGIETVLQVEIDPWCRAVLERHFPDVERVSDVRDVGEGWAARLAGRALGAEPDRADAEWVRGAQPSPDAGIDLIHGGFPCQDVSVAGNRAGLRGARSSLWFEFHRVLSLLRPTWALIENVPGLLSSNSGRDLAVILGGLEDLGYGWAFRVLDAQFFGVPQRRRRVFVVGCPGDAARAGAVLAVCEGCGGDSETGGEAGEGTPPGLADGSDNPRSHGKHNGSDRGALLIARPLTARETGYRMDWETENFLVANPVRASDRHHGHSSPRGDGADNLIAAPLTAGGHPNSNLPGRHHEDDVNLVTISAWQMRNSQGSNQFGVKTDGLFDALDTAGAPGVFAGHGVRRLTPLECERLQGFPDRWTETTGDGRAVPDSVRYRMLGNAVCCPVAEWLGWRLRHVDADR